MALQRLRLIAKMARHRPARALISLALACVLVFSCASITAFVLSYGSAVERGAQSAFGRYARQATGNDDVRSYLAGLQERGEAVAVSHGPGNLLATRTQRAVGGDATLLSGPADIGELIAGSYPESPGELSVSGEVARRLAVEVGEPVEVLDADGGGTSLAFTLVGITENPAAIRELKAVGISDDPAVFAASDVWFTDDDLAPVKDLMSRGGGDSATAQQVTRRAREFAATYQPISPQLGMLCGGALVLATLIAMYAADRQRRKGVYRVLLALSDTPRRAALTTCAQTTLFALAGGLLGGALALALLPLMSRGMSAFLEQRWDGIPWMAALWAAGAGLGAIVLAGLVTAVVMTVAPTRAENLDVTGFPRGLLFGVGIVGTLLTLVLIVTRQLFIFPQGHRVAILVGAASIPPLAYGLATLSRKRRVMAALGCRLQSLGMFALAVIFALTYHGALFASGVSALTTWLERQIEGQDSYLSINAANKEAIDNLLTRFPELAEHTAVFGDVDTNRYQFRITDYEGVLCAKQATHTADCATMRLDLVLVASGGLRDRDYVNQARASYVAPDGKVTVVGIAFADAAMHEAATLDGITPNSELENNVIGGLVLPEDAPVLRQLGFTQPETYRAIIFNFGALPDAVRDGVRATILAEAPFAFVNDSDDPEARQLRAQALVWQIVAVAVAGVLLLALVTTLIADQRVERRLVELTGGNWRTRLRLIKPLLLAYAITVTSGVVLGRLAAMDRIPFTHRDSPVVHDFGTLWAAGFCALLFLIPALLASARPDAGTPAGR